MPVDVKICGIKTTATMSAALDAGADYIGLNFFTPSPRNIEVTEAVVLANLARGKARIVALFVDPDDTLLDAVIADVRPDVIQLHGHETPERLAEIRLRTNAALMKAVKVESRDDVAGSSAWFDSADMILFDAKPPLNAISALPGGNGESFDWHILDAHDYSRPWMLSGGLDASNVAAAIVETGATAVDVSSGVERGKGEKDARLIAAFVTAAKAAKIRSAAESDQGVTDRAEA